MSVLYIDFEMTKAQFAERYSARIEDGEYIDPYNFEDIDRVFVDWQDELPAGFKTLAHFIAWSTFNLVRDKEPGLLIIDNISYFSSSSLGSSQVLHVMRALKQIKDKFGCAILVLAHTPKRAIARPLTVNDLAGSKNLANFADNIFAIGHSPHGPDIRYIKTIKVRNNPANHDASNVIVCRLEKINRVATETTENTEAETRPVGRVPVQTRNSKIETLAPQPNFPCFTFLNFANERLHTTQPYDNTNADRQHLIAEARRLSQEGYTLRQIAARLGIGLATVNRYLYEKQGR